MSVFRGVGPFNGVLPAATGQVIGFLRDPNKLPYLQYTQEVPAPVEGNGLFRYCVIDPDTGARVLGQDVYNWGFDDPMPSGRDYQIRVRWEEGQTVRKAFPFFIGDRTQAGWAAGSKLNLRNLYDKARLNEAMNVRACRVIDAIRGFNWAGINARADLQAFRGTAAGPAYWDESSGEERTPSGLANPKFQVIKKTLNLAQRRLDLTTNGATTGNEFIVVMGPRVAQAFAEAGEIVNYLKQSPNATTLMTRNKKWGIPDEYNGWKFVVEDTQKVTVREKADGSVASVALGERRYAWDDDSIFVCSRVGGLDGGYGEQSFSTVQLYTFNGPATTTVTGEDEKDAMRAGVYVKAEWQKWEEGVRGAIVTEDVPKIVSPASGYYIDGVLKP